MASSASIESGPSRPRWTDHRWSESTDAVAFTPVTAMNRREKTLP